MGWLGSLIGSTLGHIGGSFLGKPEAGREIGESIGGFIPLKKGGMVKKPKAKAKKAKKGKGTSAMKAKMAKLRAMKK